MAEKAYMDQLLDSFELKWEDLDTDGHSGEKDLLLQQLETLKHNEVTVSGMRDYIITLRGTLERELIKTPETEKVWLFFERPNRKAVIMKAQLEMCMQLEEFLLNDARAKEAISESIANIKKSKVSY